MILKYQREYLHGLEVGKYFLVKTEKIIMKEKLII